MWTLPKQSRYATIAPHLKSLKKCGVGLLEAGVAFALGLTILASQLAELTLLWGSNADVYLRVASLKSGRCPSSCFRIQIVKSLNAE
jgi:hypothetical protein